MHITFPMGHPLKCTSVTVKIVKDILHYNEKNLNYISGENDVIPPKYRVTILLVQNLPLTLI